MSEKKHLRVGQQHKDATLGGKQNTRMLRYSHQNTDSRLSVDEEENNHLPIEVQQQQQHEDSISTSNTSNTSNRELQLLNQDISGNNQFVCESLDVVDACRGTSVGYKYRGTFFPYDGPCDKGNKILDGYPIYKTKPANGEAPKFMYAIGVYPENWSSKDLAGLVRWRIVDFENFQDETTCRTESGNINQIDFAADGQPYNYWPTIYCFDENGSDLDGYKSSTINIRCNDRAPPSGYNGDGSTTDKNPTTGDPGDGGSKTALFLGILLIMGAVGFALYLLYTRYFLKQQQKTDDTERTTNGTTTAEDDQNSLINKTMIFSPNPDNDISDFEPESRRMKRPFSANSIMADDSTHSGSGEFRRPASTKSMRTVSKPYELLERKIVKEKLAPEPPKLPSPVSSPESSKRGFVLRKFAVATTNNKNDNTAGKTNDKSNTNSATDKNWGNIHTHNRLENNNTLEEPKPLQHHQYKPMKRPQDESPEEKQREPSIKNMASKKDNVAEKDLDEEGTFMSESLSNMFKDIDKSLDDILLSEDDEGNINEKTGKIPKQSEHRDPPEVKPNPATTKRDYLPPSKLGKHDEMDLSQRSKFMAARGKFSDRGRGFGKEEYQRSRSLDDSKASKHAKMSRTPVHQRTSTGGGKVAELLSKFGSPAQQPRRSKSLDNSRANEFSQSRRKTPAADVVAPPRRSKSKERSGAQRFAQQKTGNSNPRSRSKERSGAKTFAQQKTGNSNPRSRSKERSKSNTYGETNRRSRSKERSGANDYFSQRKSNSSSGATAQTPPKGRSRSKERSGANAFATKNTRRPSSQERSASNTYASRRGRSAERSGANVHASSSKARPKSLEQTGSRGYAQNSGKARPSRSLERTSAGQHASNKRATPKVRSRSLETSNANNYAAKGAPKTRSRSFDTSKANEFAKRKPVPPKPSTIITKNKDGTVVVARRRRREDGATVTTRTKYANIALARKHGIAV